MGKYLLPAWCSSRFELSPTLSNLLDLIQTESNPFTGHTRIAREQIPDWMNAIGLLLTALPESYWSVLNDRIIQLIGTLPEVEDIFQVTIPLLLAVTELQWALLIWDTI